MLWPLTWAVIIGTLPGVFLGAWARIRYLPDARTFKLFAGMVLCYIGFRLLVDVVKNKARSQIVKPAPTAEGRGALKLIEATLRKVKFQFGAESYEFSPLMVYAICFLVGIVGGIYGIGGGAIVAPFFVTIIGLPVYIVAGAALMGTFITSLAGVAIYHYLAWIYADMAVAPDWKLGALFGIGGLLGMYLGARSQKFVPAKIIKSILCGCVLLVALQYIIGFWGSL